MHSISQSTLPNICRPHEIEITKEMIEAGEDVILGVAGGADLGGFFSASELATSVYRAMAAQESKERT
jgi:basic membrane lipoprotein Med (substrate-binding protein (PBP1-ABC) superfamily)